MCHGLISILDGCQHTRVISPDIFNEFVELPERMDGILILPHFMLDYCPHILNWAEIWTLGWPFQNIEIPGIFEVISGEL
jgi:hypothetical protein